MGATIVWPNNARYALPPHCPDAGEPRGGWSVTKINAQNQSRWGSEGSVWSPAAAPGGWWRARSRPRRPRGASPRARSPPVRRGKRRWRGRGRSSKRLDGGLSTWAEAVFVPLAHLAFGSMTREAPRMPGPRVVTRVTLSRAPLNKCIHENVTVAAEGSVAHRHLEEIQCEKRSVLLSSAILPSGHLYRASPRLRYPCPRYTYPCAGLRGVGVRRSHPRARRPARPAHRPCPARDVRPPPRVPALHGITLWKPKAAQPLSSQRPERARTAHRSPARCVPPAHLSMPPCTSCGPILLLPAVLPALPREGQPSATHFSCLTQRMRSSLPCAFVQLLSPTSGSLSHSRPASVRPLPR